LPEGKGRAIYERLYPPGRGAFSGKNNLIIPCTTVQQIIMGPHFGLCQNLHIFRYVTPVKPGADVGSKSGGGYSIRLTDAPRTHQSEKPLYDRLESVSTKKRNAPGHGVR
jgi:hypothetical protein